MATVRDRTSSPVRALAVLAAALAGCAGQDAGGETGRGDAAVVDADGAAPGGDGGAPDGAPPGGAGPLAPRLENTTCKLPAAPPLGSMELVEAWPGLDFERPLWFGTAPGNAALRFVAEQGGTVYVFDGDQPAPQAEVFIRVEVSRAGNEEGLLGLAFHPRYPQNGKLYLYMSRGGARRSVISELRVDPANPRRALPESERILLEIEQPFSNHNGGDLRFGPDGFLYIAVGDGGAAGDPHGHGQDTTTLLGSILRIDVDREDPACGTPYGIPAGNPFAEGRCRESADRPEIWAWGLRNPWRMAFDRSTGLLWAGDVGQDEVEEIDVIEGGRNYGWNAVEGDRCFAAGCELGRYAPPVFTYGRDQGRSVTGGFVYRGPSLPELWGAYVFADYQSGRIWALRDGQATVLLDAREHRIASFGEDADGELHVVTFSQERSLFRLQRRADATPAEPLPARLSQTGCFTETATHTIAPGLVPYSVNAELWSDGADKLRYLALPPGGRIGWQAEGALDLPVGTVLIKTFAFGGRRLETRLLHRDETGWAGYTYRWNDAQTDADLLAGALAEEVATPDGPLTWQYPSRSQCDHCHTAELGYALGIQAGQLNRAHDYDGVRFNQLAALAGAGYLTLPGPPETLPALAEVEDPEADLAARARAYLHANCAHCHLPEGPANALIDLRATTPLAETGLCDVEPGQGDLGIEGARLLAPGDPERSVLLQRMLVRGADQMPPLATDRPDAYGANLVGAWIQSLARCP